MNSKLLAFLTATLPLAALAQINYNGGTYTEDGDSLGRRYKRSCDGG